MALRKSTWEAAMRFMEPTHSNFFLLSTLRSHPQAGMRHAALVTGLNAGGEGAHSTTCSGSSCDCAGSNTQGKDLANASTSVSHGPALYCRR